MYITVAILIALVLPYFGFKLVRKQYEKDIKHCSKSYAKDCITMNLVALLVVTAAVAMLWPIAIPVAAVAYALYKLNQWVVGKVTAE